MRSADLCVILHTQAQIITIYRDFFFYKFLVKSKIAAKRQPHPRGTFPWLWRSTLGTRLAKLVTIVGDVTGLQQWQHP